MARTKQTARKSTGGRPPRRQEQHSRTVSDHAGNPATIVWTSDGPVTGPVPRLSLQHYSICPLTTSVSGFGRQFLSSAPIVGGGNAHNWWPRVDMYAPLDSIEACMEHHRREKESRIDGATAHPLHIVPNWSRRRFRPYKNVIFVVDEPDWETCQRKGILVVQFGVDATNEQQIFDEDIDEDDVVCIEKINYSEDPRINRNCFDNAEFFREQAARLERGEFDDHNRRDLLNTWSNITRALNDCTYRLQRCDGCNDRVVHSSCPIAEDMHYFNAAGECIACAAFKGPWPEDEEEGNEERDQERTS